MLKVIKIIGDYGFLGCNSGTVAERSTLFPIMMAVRLHSRGSSEFLEV